MLSVASALLSRLAPSEAISRRDALALAIITCLHVAALVVMTATEFDLLVELARQPGRVFTRSQLLGAIHGVVVESYERTVDAHIKNIRRKLEPDPHQPRYVLTVHSVGYRFADD